MSYTGKEIKECQHKFRESYDCLSGHSKVLIFLCNNCPAVQVSQRVDGYLFADKEERTYTTVLESFKEEL